MRSIIIFNNKNVFINHSSYIWLQCWNKSVEGGGAKSHDWHGCAVGHVSLDYASSRQVLPVLN